MNISDWIPLQTFISLGEPLGFQCSTLHMATSHCDSEALVLGTTECAFNSVQPLSCTAAYETVPTGHGLSKVNSGFNLDHFCFCHFRTKDFRKEEKGWRAPQGLFSLIGWIWGGADVCCIGGKASKVIFLLPLSSTESSGEADAYPAAAKEEAQDSELYQPEDGEPIASTAFSQSSRRERRSFSSLCFCQLRGSSVNAQILPVIL